jgi:hypothetical protein
MSQHLTRRAAIATGIIIATAGSTAAAGAPDPIFAAIEAHKAAVEACRASDALFMDEADDENINRLNEVEIAAATLIEKTIPTTAAGVAALLSHYAERSYFEPDQAMFRYRTEYCDYDDQVVAAQFRAIAAMLRKM